MTPFPSRQAILDLTRELDFKIGNAIFRKVWVSAPASTKSSDGLGPLFNARSCQRCHIKDGRGHPPAANWPGDDAISMLLRLSVPPRDDTGTRAIGVRACSINRRANLWRAVAGSLHPGVRCRREIKYYLSIANRLRFQMVRRSSFEARITISSILGLGPFAKDVMISPRIAPPMIGLGLLEAIGEEDIVSWADPADGNGDGVSGRAGRVWVPG